MKFNIDIESKWKKENLIKFYQQYLISLFHIEFTEKNIKANTNLNNINEFYIIDNHLTLVFNNDIEVNETEYLKLREYNELFNLHDYKLYENIELIFDKMLSNINEKLILIYIKLDKVKIICNNNYLFIEAY